MKKNNPGISQKVVSIIITVVCVAVGLGLGFWKAGAEDRSIKNTDKYETLNLSFCSIEIPSVLENNKSDYKSTGGTVLAYYSSEHFGVSVEKFNESGFTNKDMIEGLENTTINGFKPTVIDKGDYVYFTYDSKVLDSEGKTTDGKFVSAYYCTEDAVYCIETCCISAKYSAYKDGMDYCVDSFKIN